MVQEEIDRDLQGILQQSSSRISLLERGMSSKIDSMEQILLRMQQQLSVICNHLEEDMSDDEEAVLDSTTIRDSGPSQEKWSHKVFQAPAVGLQEEEIVVVDAVLVNLKSSTRTNPTPDPIQTMTGSEVSNDLFTLSHQVVSQETDEPEVQKVCTIETPLFDKKIWSETRWGSGACRVFDQMPKQRKKITKKKKRWKPIMEMHRSFENGLGFDRKEHVYGGRPLSECRDLREKDEEEGDPLASREEGLYIEQNERLRKKKKRWKACLQIQGKSKGSEDRLKTPCSWKEITEGFDVVHENMTQRQKNAGHGNASKAVYACQVFRKMYLRLKRVKMKDDMSWKSEFSLLVSYPRICLKPRKDVNHIGSVRGTKMEYEMKKSKHEWRQEELIQKCKRILKKLGKWRKHKFMQKIYKEWINLDGAVKKVRKLLAAKMTRRARRQKLYMSHMSNKKLLLRFIEKKKGRMRVECGKKLVKEKNKQKHDMSKEIINRRFSSKHITATWDLKLAPELFRRYITGGRKSSKRNRVKIAFWGSDKLLQVDGVEEFFWKLSLAAVKRTGAKLKYMCVGCGELILRSITARPLKNQGKRNTRSVQHDKDRRWKYKPLEGNYHKLQFQMRRKLKYQSLRKIEAIKGVKYDCVEQKELLQWEIWMKENKLQGETKTEGYQVIYVDIPTVISLQKRNTEGVTPTNVWLNKQLQSSVEVRASLNHQYEHVSFRKAEDPLKKLKFYKFRMEIFEKSSVSAFTQEVFHSQRPPELSKESWSSGQLSVVGSNLDGKSVSLKKNLEAARTRSRDLSDNADIVVRVRPHDQTKLKLNWNSERRMIKNDTAGQPGKLSEPAISHGRGTEQIPTKKAVEELVIVFMLSQLCGTEVLEAEPDANISDQRNSAGGHQEALAKEKALDINKALGSSTTLRTRLFLKGGVLLRGPFV